MLSGQELSIGKLFRLRLQFLEITQEQKLCEMKNFHVQVLQYF